jgi:hypothetical protein
MNYNEAIGVVRVLIDSGIPRDAAVNNPAIPEEFRERIREELQAEEIITLEPARLIIEGPGRDEWLKHIDRSEWYYWPTLRQLLLVSKNWQIPVIRSLDAATDRILAQLSSPSTEQFDIRGLVLGYVQSGKTENYTALIAKAADVGYRLIIVLSGIDNGLRLQTQIRLKGELVGYPDKREGAVLSRLLENSGTNILLMILMAISGQVMQTRLPYKAHNQSFWLSKRTERCFGDYCIGWIMHHQVLKIQFRCWLLMMRQIRPVLTREVLTPGWMNHRIMNTNPPLL